MCVHAHFENTMTKTFIVKNSTLYIMNLKILTTTTKTLYNKINVYTILVELVQVHISGNPILKNTLKRH